ncbi:MAG: acyltransferase family protein [Actinomycetota bacterium]
MDQQQDNWVAPVVTSSFRPDIQGLRAIAVLIVVLYHTGLVTGGYIGVDVFFVLSGFLMGGLLLREAQETGRVRLWAFFSRRARRLLPALAVTTTVTVLLAAAIGPFGEVLISTTSTARATSTFFANLRIFSLSSNYFAGAAEHNALLHTWSLSVEEQFYFGLPLLLLLLCAVLFRRRAALTAWFLSVMTVIASGSLILNYLMVNRQWRVHGIWQPQQFAFFNPFTRIWEFAAGVLLAAWAAQRSRGEGNARIVLPGAVRQILAAVALVALITATFVYGKNTAFPGVAAILPVAATVILLEFGRDLPPLRRLVESQPAVRVGDLSYGWYLWHWPLIVFARYRWGENRLAFCLTALVALAAAVATHRFVEEPFRRNKRITGVWAAVLIVICVAVPYSVGRQVAHSNESQWRQNLRTYSMGPHPDLPAGEPTVAANGGRLQVHYTPTGPDAANAPRVVIVGDSHARGMTKAFGDRFAPEGIEVELLYRNGCNFLSGPSADPAACATWQTSTLNKLLAHPPTAVVLAGYVGGRLSGRKHGQTSWFFIFDEHGRRAQTSVEAYNLYERGLRNVVEALNRVGTQVILMSSEPDYPTSPFNRTSLLAVLRGRVRPTNAHLSLETARLRSAELLVTERRVAATTEHLIVVDPIPLLCTTDCSQWVDGELVYLDTDHVTYAGAMRLADGLLPILQGLRR